jgi:hypothetical protein
VAIQPIKNLGTTRVIWVANASHTVSRQKVRPSAPFLCAPGMGADLEVKVLYGP